MKLPFLLNSLASCKSGKETEQLFTKFLKVLPMLEGNQISHCFNILSKKDTLPPLSLWQSAAELLVDVPSLEKPTLGQRGQGRPCLMQTFDVKDVCIITNAFAKAGALSMKLINVVASVLLNNIYKAHASDLSKFIVAASNVKNSDPVAKLVRPTLQGQKKKIITNNQIASKDAESFLKQMNERDLSMLLRRTLTSDRYIHDKSVASKIRQMLSGNAVVISDQSIAILVNSLAKYGRDENGLLLLLSPIITTRLSQGYFTPQCIAQISNGYSRLGLLDTELLDAIAVRAQRDISNFPVRSIINVLLALSNLSHFHLKLFETAAVELTGRIAEMTPQCIGNVVAAYSKFYTKLGHQGLHRLFVAIAKHLESLDSFESFQVQNFVNVLNGLSKAKVNAPGCFRKLERQLLIRKQDFNAIDVVLALNAMARMEFVSQQLAQVLCNKLEHFVAQFKPMEISSTLNSASLLYHECVEKPEFESTAKCLLKCVVILKERLTAHVVSKFRCLDVRLVLNSLARANLLDEDIGALLLRQLVANSKHFTWVDLTNVTTGYSKTWNQLPLHFCKFLDSWIAENIHKASDVDDTITTAYNLASCNLYNDQLLFKAASGGNLSGEKWKEFVYTICLYINHWELMLNASEFNDRLKYMEVALRRMRTSQVDDDDKSVLDFLTCLKALLRNHPATFNMLASTMLPDNPTSILETKNSATSTVPLLDANSPSLDPISSEIVSSLSHLNASALTATLLWNQETLLIFN